MKQETLEEAFSNYVNEKYHFPTQSSTPDLESAKFGAKWQQEQDKNKYSEEDMRKAFKDGSWVTSWSDMGIEMKYDTFEQWFEQFKKK